MPFLIFTSLILCFDQLSKFIALKYLTIGKSLPVIEGIFHFTLVYNTGGAFGLFKEKTAIFIFIGFIAIIFILINFRASCPIYRRISLSLILSGALGNLIDRIRFGYVVDFLDVRIWPVFNVADSAVTIGVILLLYEAFIIKKR